MPVHSFTTTDKTIRSVLINKLKADFPNHANTAIIPEFNLPNGSARIDIAVVNGVLHGFELKSDMDTLVRLDSQIDAYNLIFDKVTLVVGKKHVVEALHFIPEWWGVTIAKSKDTVEKPLLIDIRKACINPTQNLFVIANLLWKSEGLKILDRIGKSKNLRNKQKKVICEKLVEFLSEKELKDNVREILIKRTLNSNWRSGVELRTYGD